MIALNMDEYDAFMAERKLVMDVMENKVIFETEIEIAPQRFSSITVHALDNLEEVA